MEKLNFTSSAVVAPLLLKNVNGLLLIQVHGDGEWGSVGRSRMIGRENCRRRAFCLMWMIHCLRRRHAAKLTSRSSCGFGFCDGDHFRRWPT